MIQDDTKNIDQSQLIYEHHRLDNELEIVRGLASELKKHGRYISSEYVDEAKQHLMQAIISIKTGLDWIDTVANHEQMKLDIYVDC